MDNTNAPTELIRKFLDSEDFPSNLDDHMDAHLTAVADLVLDSLMRDGKVYEDDDEQIAAFYDNFHERVSVTFKIND